MKMQLEQQRAGNGCAGSGREVQRGGREADENDLFTRLIDAGLVDPVKVFDKADEIVKKMLQQYPALYPELAEVLSLVDELQHEAETAGFILGFCDALDIVNGLLAYTGTDLKTFLEKAEKHEQQRNQNI